ncbi:MAG: TnpA family transposase [Gammaproteobacteria bacterium]|jgi:TnpA family transposase
MSEPWDWDEVLPRSDRLRILSPEEYELLWGLPRFSPSDREVFFGLNALETALLRRLRTPRTQAHFLLQLGYFRARQRFFALDPDTVAEDLAYVCAIHLDGASVNNLALSKHTRQQHINVILAHLGFRTIGTDSRADLEARALRAARISSRPLYVLRDLVDHLRHRQVVLPGYSYLQDIVQRALSFERNRLSEALRDAMTPADEALLDSLLSDDHGLHTVTSLKHDPRDFSHKQLLTEIERGEQIRPLFAVAQRIITQAELSFESVRFYASLVDYYTVYKLKRMNLGMARLYLLCFARDRYQRLNDHLLSAFCALVRRYAEKAAQATRERVYLHRRQANEDLERGVNILRLFLDPKVSGERPFAEVRAHAAALLPSERLISLCEHLSGDGALDELSYEWQAIDAVMPMVKRNLRPLLRFLTFTGASSQQPLLEAIGAMAEAFRLGGRLPMISPPVGLVPDRHRGHLFNASGVLVRDRFEFMLYRLLRDRLEAGDICCAHSGRFRSFEDDLVDEETLARKNTLLPQVGLVDANIPIKQQLAELRQTLDERFEQVNARIRHGDNRFITLRNGQTVWTKGHDDEALVEHEPLFDAAERIDIDQLLLHVDRQTDFLAAFEHVMGRYQREKASKPVTVAALIAFATNMGLGRMAEISNLTRGQLATTAANFIRLETLREANDRLANATARLPIFRHFDIGDAVHSSSDGQKFEAAIPTINARHSAKYFGLKKGVVAYTLLASHVPLSARIIGANEHESHYVFDVLFNNLTDIQPETHSTDTHGANQINFALMHLFGYRFAPRFRNFRRKAKLAIYGFQHPRDVDGPLKPVRRIREQLIISEWPNIERILLSLALKTTTQSVIVSKLSSYRRQNRTKQALWEFDHIIRSLYLLDYADSPSLRRNVHRALNRGEAYHRMRRAVAYAHGGRFRVRSQHEQELWNECARLIANAVVHYNGILLSEVLKTLQHQQDTGAIDALNRVSPLAWQHVNFYGRYRFDSDLRPINLAAIAEQLTAGTLSLKRRIA